MGIDECIFCRIWHWHRRSLDQWLWEVAGHGQHRMPSAVSLWQAICRLDSILEWNMAIHRRLWLVQQLGLVRIVDHEVAQYVKECSQLRFWDASKIVPMWYSSISCRTCGVTDVPLNPIMKWLPTSLDIFIVVSVVKIISDSWARVRSD